MSNFIKFSLISFSLLFFLAGNIAIAAGLVPDPTGPISVDCPAGQNCGNYTLNDILSTVLLVSNFILGIVGSLALFALTAGGLMWILSGGNAEWVSRGKEAVKGAVIGLAIVFTSFMIIQLVFLALGIEGADNGKLPIGTWSVSDWFIKHGK